MRTIKFKAKRLDNDKWVKDYFYVESGNIYIIEGKQRESMLNRHIPHFVAPTTICQFTGFRDKVGKDIYEGDVLRPVEYSFSSAPDGKYDNYYGIVLYCEERAAFYIMAVKNPKFALRGFSDGVTEDITQEKLKKFEVVGNIHEDEWKKIYAEYFPTEEEKEAEDD